MDCHLLKIFIFDLRNKLLLFVKSKNDNIISTINIEDKHGIRIAD